MSLFLPTFKLFFNSISKIPKSLHASLGYIGSYYSENLIKIYSADRNKLNSFDNITDFPFIKNTKQLVEDYWMEEFQDITYYVNNIKNNFIKFKGYFDGKVTKEILSDLDIYINFYDNFKL